MARDGEANKSTNNNYFMGIILIRMCSNHFNKTCYVCQYWRILGLGRCLRQMLCQQFLVLILPSIASSGKQRPNIRKYVGRNCWTIIPLKFLYPCKIVTSHCKNYCASISYFVVVHYNSWRKDWEVINNYTRESYYRRWKVYKLCRLH